MPVTVSATFADNDDARAAAVELERRGVDASAISVRTLGPAGRQDRWRQDLATTRDVGRRSLLGGVVGAVVVAAAAVAVVVVIGPSPLGLAAAAAGTGGAIAGAVLGGFWAGAGELPVAPSTYDTYRPHAGSATVVVRIDESHEPDELDEVRQVLRERGARDVRTDRSHSAGA